MIAALAFGAALHEARPRETIVVRGTQRGTFVVRTPRLTIEGGPGAVLDADGHGTVLTIDAPDVVVRDLNVRGSGSDFVGMDAGIRVNAARAKLDNVHVEDSLFGIYLAQADGSSIERSTIAGREWLPVPLRGDGLRIWYSRGVRIEGNTIRNARDDLIWFSSDASILNNTISGGRYGIHTMYSNGMTIAHNVIRDCEVGSYAMYGANLRVAHNLFVANRGSTGYGIGLKAIDGAVVSDNAFVSNHAALYVDNSPSLVGSTDRFLNNFLAYNEIGVATLPSSRGDTFAGNSFVDNYRQVSILGGGNLGGVVWSQGGRGNYWSDYAGYDRNGDGVGDMPYVERSVYGALADLDPRLEILVYSPAARALDFAANALPLFASSPVVSDASPAMEPAYPQGVPVIVQSSARAAYASIGILALMASFGVLVPLRRRNHHRGASSSVAASAASVAEESALIARIARKRYGKIAALENVHLDVRRGEALALWGPNGSGKTTLIRCMLGIVEFEGAVEVHGTVGYVPQQLPVFDMRVEELADFIAVLHRVPKVTSDDALRDAGVFDLKARGVSELSGGQRQRLALALASLGNPEILFLDEPTVGLDLESRRSILRYLEGVRRQGRTVVVSSHVPEDVLAIADRIAVIDAGHVTDIFTPRAFAEMIEGRREKVS